LATRGIEFLGPLIELALYAGEVLFEQRDATLKLVDVGGRAKAGFFPGGFTKGLGETLLQLSDPGTALYGRLRYSVEPMEAWERPEGYWLATSRAYPHSPGWSQQEQQQVAALREKARDLTGVILTHAFWDGGAAPHRPDARSQLKYALDVHEAGRDQEV
jgi:hypothetical protein